MWGFQAKGKGGKGKDKGKAASPEGGKGHTLPRTRITAEKFTGTVAAWKGKYGWIIAAEEIEHEKAALRGGKLFAGIEDIVGAESLDEGAEVEFHIFEDESGLGAEEIVQTGEGNPAAAKGAGKAFGKVAGKTMGKAFGKVANGDSWGKGKVASSWGGKGWDSPATAKGGMKGFASAFTGFASSWKGGKDSGKDKGKGKGKKGGKGHLLPRTRITAEKFTGTVSAWKGKYGWITPSEPIEHEKASLHNGSLFASINDLVDAESLTDGATVEFHIAEDSSGLCAEEVVAY